MPVIMDSARMAASNISNLAFASYKALSIHFIVHHSEHLSEALGVAAQEILWHPAAESALHFLKTDNNQTSGILGIAFVQENGLFLTGSKKRYLCICNLNLGQYETLEELKRAAWHFTWHAIYHIERFEEEYTPGRKQRKNNNVRITIRENIERTAANLCADTFSAIMAAHEGDSGAMKTMAVQKANRVLQKNPHDSPEYYAFPIAIDAAEKAISLYMNKTLPKRRLVYEAVRLSSSLREVFDRDALKQWVLFAGRAQNMIWRGIEKDKIIGAAMYMSSHTEARLIAHQICELLELKPYSITGDTRFYNSFMDAKMANKCHNHLIDEKFEKLLARALQMKSGAPFKEAADRQNTNLCTGEVNGWCALALQYAGKAIDVALESGNDPAALAQNEFDSCRFKVTLEDLRLLNINIIHEMRRGSSITMEKIKAICSKHDNLRLVGQSVNMTMTASPPSDKRKAINA